MGRRKIEIKPIRDDRNRSVTFLKRKGGLFKKAHELSVLCSVDVAVIIFGHNKKLYEYSSGDINETIGRFQYYGGAHEHKGPADFADKHAGDDEDEDEDAGDEAADERGTPEHRAMMQQPPHMQNHPGFQHVRHGTPSHSPPMPNGAMPQFQRGPSPLPPGISRPSSRASQHTPQPHLRRPSSNLAPPGHPQHSQGPPPPGSYAYSPNPPFYNAQAAAQVQRPPPQATYPPPTYHPQHAAQNAQIQQAVLQDQRRSSMPPAFPSQPPPQANMQRNPSQEHLHPPPQQHRPHQSPQPGQQRATPSPQPPQQQFASPPIPQPRPLPAHAKQHSIFTPIDDSRSLLAQHWGSTAAADHNRPHAAIKIEGTPRSSSVDVASMQRGKSKEAVKANGMSPRPPVARPPPGRSPQPPQRHSSINMPIVGPPTRSNTNQSDAKRPRLKVQIPSEHSGDEGGTANSEAQASSTSANPNGPQHQPPGPSHGVVLPPPSPSANALLSAGAQGPPNPFARPAPPMSTNPHAANRDANHIETPISALPSRFMSDNLLPSPSTFYPEWGFGRSGDSNMLPSPLNFQTPIVPNGAGWREDDRKRAAEEEANASSKRARP